MQTSATSNLIRALHFSCKVLGAWVRQASRSNFPKPYIFDADNNLAGAFQRVQAQGISFKYDVGDVDENGKEVPLSKRYARMVQCLTAAYADPEIETIILDSASAISDYVMAEVLTKINKSELTGTDWNYYFSAWKQLIMKLRAQGKPLIIIAHTRLEKDGLDGKYSI